MLINYELYELNGSKKHNFAAKAANFYESGWFLLLRKIRNEVAKYPIRSSISIR